LIVDDSAGYVQAARAFLEQEGITGSRYMSDIAHIAPDIGVDPVVRFVAR